jgi:hypothetical protein
VRPDERAAGDPTWRYDPATGRLQETLPSGEVLTEHRTFPSEEEARRALEGAIRKSTNVSEGRAEAAFPWAGATSGRPTPGSRVSSRPDTTHHIGQHDQHGVSGGTAWRNEHVAPDGTRHVYLTCSIGEH